MTQPLKLSMVVGMETSDVRKGVAEVKGSLSELDKAADAARRRAIDVVSGQGLPELASKSAAGIKLAAYETQNLARQLSDIGVSLASGQSPFMVMIQQGAQIQDIMGSRGVAGMVTAVGQGIGSLITPATLALAGLTALGYGASAVFSAMSGDARSTEEVLSAHEEVIKRISEAYSIAEDAARGYARESASILVDAASNNLEAIQQKLQSEVQGVRDIFASIFANPLDPGQAINLADDAAPFEAIFRRITDEADKAWPSLRSVRDEIIGIKNEAGQSEGVRKFAQDLLDATEEASRLERAAPAAVSAISAIGGAAEREAEAIRAMTSAMKGLGDIAKVPLTERETAETLMRQGMNGAGGLEERIAVRRAYEQAIRRIEQLKLEISLLGRSGAEVEALRIEQDMLGRLAQRGITVGEKELANIKAKAAAQAQYRETLATTRLEQDLLFEREQMFRSPTEQRVYSSLRSAGVDPSSERGQAIADQIRMNEQLSFGRDLAFDFGQSLVGAFQDGKLEGRELLDILFKIAQQLLSMPGGMSGIGNVLSGVLGGGLGAFPAAPSGLGMESGVGLFDSGGTILDGGNVIPFGPKTRRLKDGIIADSGLGPRHFKAVLEQGETVLTRQDTMRTMNALSGLAGGGIGNALNGILRLVLEPSELFNVRMEQVSGDVAGRLMVEGLDEYERKSTQRFNRDARQSQRIGAR